MLVRARFTATRLALVMLFLTLALAGVTTAGAAPADAATPSTATPTGGPVVLIGVPGLRWDDISPRQTPNLWRLARAGSIGNLSVRATTSLTCPIDGWLTVSAGQRASLHGRAHAVCGLPPTPVRRGGGATVRDFAATRSYNLRSDYHAHVGLLGSAVHAAGGTTMAVGPGAALAAADSNGHVDRYYPSVDRVPTGAWRRSRIAVVDLDAIARSYADAGADAKGRQVPVRAAKRRAAVAAADQQAASVLTAVPGPATVLLAGVSDDTGGPSHLHVAMATGPAPAGAAYTAGLLGSDSTHRDGLVTLTDITSTLLRSAGARPGSQSAAIGKPWERSGDRRDLVSAIDSLRGQDTAAQLYASLSGLYYTVLIVTQLALYLAAAIVLRRRRWDERARGRVLAGARVVALAGGSAAVATYLANLVPWWDAPHPAVAVLAAIAVADLIVVALALAGPWRKHVLAPSSIVAGITATVLCADVVTGARLQMDSLTGYSPIVAGRFYGVGNIAFAVLITAVLLSATGLAQPLLSAGRRRTAVVAVVLVGLAGAAVDGAPIWGDDFGGVIAFIPATIATAILISGRRVSLVKFLLGCAAGVVTISAIAIGDYLRPPEHRTHMGIFVQQVLDGSAGGVVARKLGSMLRSLGYWEFTILAACGFIFLFFVLLRPLRWRAGALQMAFEDAPALRAGLIGTLIAVLIGFAVNDSGVEIPAIALTVASPLALAAALKALQRRPPSPAEQATKPAGDLTAGTSGAGKPRPAGDGT